MTRAVALDHTSWVWSVTFSRDGATLAAGFGDGVVALWDTATMTRTATFPPLRRQDYAAIASRSVALSPNGATLASGTDNGKIVLWDVAEQERIATLEGHTDSVRSVFFSPNGEILASGSEDGTVLLWNLQLSLLQAPRLVIISGDDQLGTPGSTLGNPFVVEVQDQYDKPLPNVEVTFSVTSGDGTLSPTSATTDSNGRAESILTLGPKPGTNTVEVTVTGTEEKLTFSAEGIRIPKTLEIVSGSDQEGLPGEVLENPFVVEVRDQFDNALPEAEVTFTVTNGDGTLSATSTTTDSSGRAESTFTLGPNPGTNTVTVSVAEIQEKPTFNAEGIRIPKTLEIVSGADQEGLPGAALENPFVVEVRDEFDESVPGRTSHFHGHRWRRNAQYHTHYNG